MHILVCTCGEIAEFKRNNDNEGVCTECAITYDKEELTLVYPKQCFWCGGDISMVDDDTPFIYVRNQKEYLHDECNEKDDVGDTHYGYFSDDLLVRLERALQHNKRLGKSDSL